MKFTRRHLSLYISGAICRAKKVFLHTDAAQAVGKVPVDVNEMKIDLMSISGHKIYGPKGVNLFLTRFMMSLSLRNSCHISKV